MAFADTCVFPTASLRGHFVVVGLMKPLAHKVDFQSPFVGAPATDNYIYSSPFGSHFYPARLESLASSWTNWDIERQIGVIVFTFCIDGTLIRATIAMGKDFAETPCEEPVACLLQTVSQK